jgi:Homeodomain-like domain
LWGKRNSIPAGTACWWSRPGVFRLCVVLACVLYRLLCCVVGVLAGGGGERELEIVVLRHQLAILRRGGKRPRYTTADRALLAAASRLLPRERWSCFAVSPRTLRRWHLALLEGGRRRRRRRPGRPPLAAETRELIRRLARENPRWGYMRIEGELLKLGISVSATTIATVLRSSGLGPAPRRIGPSWSEFLRAQAHSMLGGSPSSAAGDDAPADDASEPNGSPQLWPDRQIEAGDHFSAADAVEPRSTSHPMRSHSAPPRARGLPAIRGPLRLRPSHRSHARDGPQRAGPALVPQPSAQARRQSHPVQAAFAAIRASDPLGRLRGSSAPRRRRNRSTTSPSRTPEPSFFTPHVFHHPHLHVAVMSPGCDRDAAPLLRCGIPHRLSQFPSMTTEILEYA